MNNDITFRKDTINFLGEQDGKIEKNIKEIWKEILKKFDFIQEAYLPIIEVDESTKHTKSNPALCIYPYPINTEVEKGVVDNLSKSFKEMFGPNQFLDIMFLSEEERKKCMNVCKSFYQK